MGGRRGLGSDADARGPHEVFVNRTYIYLTSLAPRFAVCIGDDPFKLALDFCANHNLTNTDPDLDANGKFVGNFRQYEAENKYVKMVKDHIMKFIDTSTTKVGGVPVRKCVGKKGSLNWQKAAAVAAAKGAAPTTNQRAGEETEAKKDPFSVQPSIPQNKRMSSISTSEANSTSGIEPANKKNKTDKTPTGKGVKGAHEAGAAIAARAAAATASPAPSSTALSTSAKESPHATVSKPKSTSKPAPKPTPSKAAQFSTGSEDEGGIGALAIGAVIIGVAAIGFIMLRKKK